MPIEDIRIKLGFKDHRKRKKINLALGLQKSATDYLLDLWISTAQNNPDGVLRGMNHIDIAMEAGWEGDPDIFVLAIGPQDIGIGFLDKDENGTYKIHDWEEHQPWVFYSKERSKKARKAAFTKWGYNKEPDESEIKTRSERIKEARLKGTHTEEEWLEIKDYFGECVKCMGKSGLTHLDRDHIMPIYQGGSDGIDNIQPMCADCNNRKGSDNTDYRILFCIAKNIEMPSKWLPDACNEQKLTPVKLKKMYAPLLTLPYPSSPNLSLPTTEQEASPRSSSKHWEKNLGEFWKRIKIIRDELVNDYKMSNVDLWLQMRVNEKGHPEAIMYCMEQAIKKLYKLEAINNFMGYATKIFQKENSNFINRDKVKEHEFYKQMAVEDMDVKKILKDIGNIN